MKTRDTNAGTPFSYAVPGQGNEPLVDYIGSIFYLCIGGEARLVRSAFHLKEFLKP